jgi:hypothetical protein
MAEVENHGAEKHGASSLIGHGDVEKRLTSYITRTGRGEPVECDLRRGAEESPEESRQESHTVAFLSRLLGVLTIQAAEARSTVPV